MGEWFFLNLGDPLLAEPALDDIRQALARSSGRGAAFSRHASSGRPHCELHVYFCPDSVDLAEALGARACRKPEPAELGLLGGPPDAWRTHFPNSSQARTMETSR